MGRWRRVATRPGATASYVWSRSGSGGSGSAGH